MNNYPDTHVWLTPKLKPQVDSLESIGFYFLGDCDKFWTKDDNLTLKLHTVGRWKDVQLVSADFEVLEAIIDGGLYCLELEVGVANSPELVELIIERLNKFYVEPKEPKQLTLF